MGVFWTLIVIFGLVAIIFLFLSISVLIEDGIDEDSLGFGFIFLIAGTIVTCMLFNVDYHEGNKTIIYPQQTSILHDDEEIIIKYGDNRWERSNHKEYVQILDSNFHVVRTEWTNIFGHDEGPTYSLKVFEEEEMVEEEDTSIPIEL